MRIRKRTKLSNSTIFNDLAQISRSHHYLMLNASETASDTDIATMEY